MKPIDLLYTNGDRIQIGVPWTPDLTKPQMMQVTARLTLRVESNQELPSKIVDGFQHVSEIVQDVWVL